MQKNNLIKKGFKKKIKDYTFTILFFLIFSFFIVFVIKPSLSTAVSLKKEETDLRQIDNQYESYIANIISVQSFIENRREDIPLLIEAVSNHPQVNKVIDDIKKASDQTNLVLKKISIGEVNLINIRTDKINTLSISIEGNSDFDSLMEFIKILLDQRRLKTVQKMVISRDQQYQTMSDNQLKVTMDIEVYYL